MAIRMQNGEFSAKRFVQMLPQQTNNTARIIANNVHKFGFGLHKYTACFFVWTCFTFFHIFAYKMRANKFSAIYFHALPCN